MAEGNLFAIRSVELTVEPEAATAEFVAAMMAPIDELIAELEAAFKTEGLPKWRKVRVTPSLSDTLRALLKAEGAFHLKIEYDHA